MPCCTDSSTKACATISCSVHQCLDHKDIENWQQLRRQRKGGWRHSSNASTTQSQQIRLLQVVPVVAATPSHQTRGLKSRGLAQDCLSRSTVADVTTVVRLVTSPTSALNPDRRVQDGRCRKPEPNKYTAVADPAIRVTLLKIHPKRVPFLIIGRKVFQSRQCHLHHG